MIIVSLTSVHFVHLYNETPPYDHPVITTNDSLRSWRFCVGARLKFWRRSRVPKKGSRDEAVEISRGFPARDGSDYITTAPLPNLTRLLHNNASYAG